MATAEKLELFKAVLECFGDDCTFEELLEYCGAITDKEQLEALLTGTNIPVFRYADPTTPGVLLELWDENVAAPHGDIRGIFTGAIDSTLTPSHVSGPPTLTVNEPDFTLNSAALGNNPADQFRASGWIYLQDGFVEEMNGNTGERADMLIARCGGVLKARDGAHYDTDTVSGDSSVLDVTAVSEGWHYFVGRMSDITAFGGYGVRFSADGTTFANITTGWQQDMPKVECLLIDVCDTLPEGYSYKPLTACEPPTFVEVPLIDVAVPVASSAVPIPDNEVDDQIRTGSAGTSADFSSADHNHPIRKQQNPGNPVLTVVGPNNVLDQGPVRFDSTEEELFYEMRPRVEIPPGSGWTQIVVPNIAGFGLPRCYTQGTFRNLGNPQPDDGTNGALPESAYMGGEGGVLGFHPTLLLRLRAC